MIQVFEGDGEASEFEQQRLDRLRHEKEQQEYERLMRREDDQLKEMRKAIRFYMDNGEDFLAKTAWETYAARLSQLHRMAADWVEAEPD